MTVALQPHRFTVDEYHQLRETGILGEDDRVELIEGELVDMNPIGSRHAGCVNRLTKRLHVELLGRVLIAVQNPLALPGSELYPDLVVLRNREDFYGRAHAGPDDVLLLVEVADSSLAADRRVKVPLYARHGLRQVWLVDLEAETVEDYRQPTASGYVETRPLRRGDILTAEAFPELRIAVADVLG